MTATADYPRGFFDRVDSNSDAVFYQAPRLVTHIDDGAIAAVRDLYGELKLDGGSDRPRRVLDLMSSWVSHLATAPAELVVLGLNQAELDANPMATERVRHDLNADPSLPFPDETFDAVLCCVSIDYLIHPVEVVREAVRVLRPDAPLVITFSNRCFPSKAIRGWLSTDDAGRCAIVAGYLQRAGGLTEPEISERARRGRPARVDPLYAVVARKSTR